MTNKVDGITLLQMIKDGKIKDSTKFKMFGLALTRDNPPHELVEFNGRTILHRFGELSLSQLLNFDLRFEIIEEIEKPKEIEKLTIRGKDIRYGAMEEWLDFPLYQNEEKICNAIEQIAINQNKIIEIVDYLLKKEEDK